MQQNGPRRSDAYLTAIAQILAVVLTGITNYVATKQTVETNRVEIERARDEVHQIFLNQKPVLESHSSLRVQADDMIRQAKENNQVLKDITKNLMPNSQLAAWGQSTSDNAKKVEELTKRIEQLEQAVVASKTAAQKAAGASSRAKEIVNSRVVTTQDKVELRQQQRELVAKKQQLNRTIKQVKKHGPSLWQQMGFH